MRVASQAPRKLHKAKRKDTVWHCRTDVLGGIILAIASLTSMLATWKVHQTTKVALETAPNQNHIVNTENILQDQPSIRKEVKMEKHERKEEVVILEHHEKEGIEARPVDHHVVEEKEERPILDHDISEEIRENKVNRHDHSYNNQDEDNSIVFHFVAS